MKYEESHPWITFKADLRRQSYAFWLLLGEAQSKCFHIAGVPLRPEVAETFHRASLAKGVQATTAIEGNTLSVEDVQAEMRGELRVPPSKKYQQREISNMLGAFGEVFTACKHMKNPTTSINPKMIADYNRRVLDGVPLEKGVVPGELRTYSVGVGTYRAPPAEDCEYLLGRLCEWLDEKEFEPGDHANLGFAIIKAMLAHLYLAWIHPFGDGNGRTARLVEFHVLVCAGVPTPAAHLLSNHYNETRSEYYRQLTDASGTADPTGFLRYALVGFVDGLRNQVEKIRAEHIRVAWKNHVHEMLGGSSPAVVRQRHLLLSLPTDPSPLTPQQILLRSADLAAEYSLKTSKTLTRDLNALIDCELLLRLPSGEYVPNIQRVKAYIPKRVQPDGFELEHPKKRRTST